MYNSISNVRGREIKKNGVVGVNGRMLEVRWMEDENGRLQLVTS